MSPHQKIYKQVPDYSWIKQRIQPFGSLGIVARHPDQRPPGKLVDHGLVARYLHPSSLKIKEGTAVLIGTRVYDVHWRACKWDPNRQHDSPWWDLEYFHQRIDKRGKIVDLASPLRNMKVVPPSRTLKKRDTKTRTCSKLGKLSSATSAG